MKRLGLTLLTSCVFLSGCKSASKDTPPAPASVPAPQKAAKVFSPSDPPTQKQVLRALLRLQDAELAGIPSCSGVGTEPSDVNIGDYISGFLAEQGSSMGGNSIEVSAKEDQDASHQRAWRSEVVIRHLDGEDRWGWGVSFLMRPADHSVVKESIQCVGAG